MKIIKKILTVLIFLSAGYGTAFCQTAGNPSKRKPGNPLDNLPSNIEALTYFGERADISPDSKSIAFMAKSFGDAMKIDVATKKIECLTCNVPAAAFLRVMHLSNGDYLLIGPDHFENTLVSKGRDSELWYLSKERGSKPVKVGLKISGGIAVSKKNMKMAFTETELNGAQQTSRIIVADLVLSAGVPALANKKTVLESSDQTCVIEAQDFYSNDTKLIFFCETPVTAEVKGVDMQTRQVTDFSKIPGAFNEPEGIFPDGQSIAVESDRQSEWLGGQRGLNNLDIWKLKLDGTGKDAVRLTNFNDYEGGKASNPVISSDGRFMSFQSAKATDPPGIGYGILIYWFKK